MFFSPRCFHHTEVTGGDVQQRLWALKRRRGRGGPKHLTDPSRLSAGIAPARLPPPPPAPGRSLRAAADVSPAPPPCSPVAGLPPCPAGPGPAFPPPGRVRTAPGLLLAGCGRAGRGVSPPGTGAPCRPPRPGRCAGVEGQFGRWWCGNCSASFSGTVAFKLAGGWAYN